MSKIGIHCRGRGDLIITHENPIKDSRLWRSDPFDALTSLEVQELASGPVTDTVAIPIANIVVPAGTTININATLTGTNNSSSQISGMDNSDPGTDFGGTTTAGS